MKHIIKEDPDSYYDSNQNRNLVFMANNASCLIFGKDFYVVLDNASTSYMRVTHNNVFKCLFYRYFEEDVLNHKDRTIIKMWKELYENMEAMFSIKVYGNEQSLINLLEKFKNNILKSNKTIAHIYSRLTRSSFIKFGINNDILNGRIWANMNSSTFNTDYVMSFWAGKEKVFKFKDQIQKYLDSSKIKTDTVRIDDWKNQVKIPEDGNEFTEDDLISWDEYFGNFNKKESDDVEAAAKDRTLHTLPPEQKSQKLKLMGVKPKFKDFKDYYYQTQGQGD